MQDSFIKAGVIGYPVKHSKSPLLHEHWITRHQKQGAYDAIEVPPEKLENMVQDLIDRGYAGFNITLPHKQTIMHLCTDIDDTARAVGAVNTVTIEDGRLYGRNTDVFGFLENIRAAHPDFAFTGIHALVLGAGGAARAVIYGLIDAGAKQITITNRTRAKADDIAASFADLAAQHDCRLSVLDWDDRDSGDAGAAPAETDLLVNTTSLGMTGKPSLSYDVNALPSSAMVCDIVYAPLYTDLLSDARARGLRITTGIGMLLHQARPAFAAWFGVMPDVDDLLEQKILKA